MNLHETLTRLTSQPATLCLTLSLPTHRTHPENLQDLIHYKNLVKEAKERLLTKLDKRTAQPYFDLLDLAENQIDFQTTLDSLHIFVTDSLLEIVTLDIPVENSVVYVSPRFSIGALIQAVSERANYLMMVLSQGGVQLYEMQNEMVEKEIQNEQFPISESRFFSTHSDKASDGKQVDNLLKEFLNRVDKAFVQVTNETGLSGIVVSTPENYTALLSVADQPSVYVGHAAINYNQMEMHDLGKQARQVVREVQQEQLTRDLEKAKELVSTGRILTDPREIYNASIQGRGDVLFVEKGYAPVVEILEDRTIDISTTENAPTQDDFIGKLAWKVYSKKGRVYFMDSVQAKELGSLFLQVRY